MKAITLGQFSCLCYFRNSIPCLALLTEGQKKGLARLQRSVTLRWQHTGTSAKAASGRCGEAGVPAQFAGRVALAGGGGVRVCHLPQQRLPEVLVRQDEAGHC